MRWLDVDSCIEEKAIRDNAIAFAKANKKQISRRLTNPEIYPPEDDPVSVFMAGSPGAGKTEASIALVNLFADTPILRIDPDELRSEFQDYVGGNAWLFQGAVSILVDRILDAALEQKQSMLLDGTLANEELAIKNISRALKRKRFVQILYVYQEPMLAWQFVQAREATEGRRIRPEHFISQFFAARDVVNAVKLKFGKEVRVDLLLKNNDNSSRLYKAGVEKIDYHVPQRHTKAMLEELLGINHGARNGRDEGGNGQG